MHSFDHFVQRGDCHYCCRQCTQVLTAERANAKGKVGRYLSESISEDEKQNLGLAFLSSLL